MKVQSTTDFCSGQTSLWLWEEVSDGAAHYWFNEGKMEAIHVPKGTAEFPEIKPFMVLPHREYKQVMEALVTFLKQEKIKPENEISLQGVIDAKEDHLNFAENVTLQLLEKLKS